MMSSNRSGARSRMSEPAALELDHAGGVALAEHLERRLVVERDVVDVEVDPPCAERPDGVLDHR